MLSTAFALDTPAAVRYPRGVGPGVAIDPGLAALPVGKGEIRRTGSRRGNRVALLAFGSMLHPALAAAEELDATVANMRFVKPLDLGLVVKLAHEHDALVTLEENVVMGGAGSAVAEALAAEGIVIPFCNWGCRMPFPITAIQRNYSRPAASTPRASSLRCRLASASAAPTRWPNRPPEWRAVG
jgi:1-deoxy-D-xylulose-5-phosphate synthase